MQHLRRLVSFHNITRITRKYFSMEALQFNAQTKKLELITKEIPQDIGDNQVLVEVHYAGICGTDLHIIAGEFPCQQDKPLVLGHEFCGIVAKIGKNVKHVQVGDKIVTDPSSGCMACYACRNGNPHFCKNGGLNAYIGMFMDGGWEQYALVPDVQIHKVPESITLEQAALCEPLSCISHAWDRCSPVPMGTRVLIVGSGIIGNLFASILHLQGHKKVTISEPSQDRLKMTAKLETGFELITPTVLAERAEKDKNYLFDLIIDCSGNAKAIEHAFSLMDFGARMCIFGVANPTANMSILPYDMFKKELSIYGAAVNPFSFPKALNFLESMGSRYIDYDKLGVKVFSLQQYKEAIDNLKKGSIAKATFKLQEKNSSSSSSNSRCKCKCNCNCNCNSTAQQIL